MKEQQQKHFVDIIFIIVLVGVFVLMSLFLIIMGSRVYSTTVDHMDVNYDARTLSAYLSEKVQQQDRSGSIALDEFGSSTALLFTEKVAGREYETRVYLYEGYLTELLGKADSDLSPAAGHKLLPCESFEVEAIGTNLFHVDLVTSSGEEVSIYLNPKSDAPLDEEGGAGE